MNKHKQRIIAVLLSVLCFFVISVSFSHGTYAYIFGLSHICRSDFYTEKPENSVPESSAPENSIPESSSEEPSTGDKTDRLPIMAVSVVSMAVISAICMFSGKSKRKTTDGNSDTTY